MTKAKAKYVPEGCIQLSFASKVLRNPVITRCQHTAMFQLTNLMYDIKWIELSYQVG